MAKSIERYHCIKKSNSKRKGIDFLLEASDIRVLLSRAGITIEQVGIRNGMYQLARYNDTGPYSLDNCRFITKEENLAERNSHKGSGAGVYVRTSKIREKQRQQSLQQKRNNGKFA